MECFCSNVHIKMLMYNIQAENAAAYEMLYIHLFVSYNTLNG